MAKLSAGYSGTPLLQKLGIKEDMKVKLIGEPMNYFDLLEKDIAFQFLQKKNETPDFIHLFAKTKNNFEAEMKKIKKITKATTIIWVSWYKKVQELRLILQKM